ncbi:uncharacterized protein LOC134257544 isoform X2 [Saccostrea cucullata]|uniref:uncharacterized protein LOC134257544 isoform X2 n=1 Tax=Saccostrea cuccullata TaxID=36930 RepID=UPI002ED1075F
MSNCHRWTRFLNQKTLHLSLKKWSILIVILMSTDYCLYLHKNWKERFEEIQKAFPTLQDDVADEKNEVVKELIQKDIVLKEEKKENCVRFLSDDIRHQVASYFIKNCLKTQNDYKNYIKLSSVDSLLEYVRTWWYRRDENERCLYLPVKLEKLFVKRLGVDTLRHIVLKKGIESSTTRSSSDRDQRGFNEFRDKILKYGRMPNDVLNLDHLTRERFCKFARAIIDPNPISIRALSYNSLLGSFFIDENTSKPDDQKSLHLSLKKWGILITIFMSADYCLNLHAEWKDKIKEIRTEFPPLQEDERDEEDQLIDELLNKDIVLQEDEKKNSVRFLSDNIRHQVASYFIKNCLKTHKNYKNYIKLSSIDSLMEYVRPWWYKRESNERCLYLPEKLDELYIRRVGIDVVRHAALAGRLSTELHTTPRTIPSYYSMGNVQFRHKISKYLNVPGEILIWGQEARCRYVDCAKKGTRQIHRARAMIVGCAGAGKTTLLKRLQKRSLTEIKQVKSTIGLEVHEDIFEIDPDSCILKALTTETDKEGKPLLSVMDLGGQCAYYACHQVYLSRRAFYLLVIDMSKDFIETVDPSECEQEETMFADWTYGEYITFWLKSVHTYCDDNSPVIVVGTHLDNTRGKNSNTLYNSILDHIKYNKHLKNHLSRERCFVLGFKSNEAAVLDEISKLEKCIVSIARGTRWKETIPADWALTEVVLREHRKQKKMCSIIELLISCFQGNVEKFQQLLDVLKFYHDIGIVLYFHESNLFETVIIDIQWFIDSFKNIIADPNHVRDIADNNRDWLDFYRTGHIQDKLLTSIWNSKHFKINKRDKTNLLQYMQRLGLIAISTDPQYIPRSKMQRRGPIAVRTNPHYIPCMNKRTFGKEEEEYFQSLKYKTSVLVFRFNFLPYFFFFRLIVACLQKHNREWRVLEDNGLCLYKNVACFEYKQHAVALAVNKSSIQLQVFQPANISITKSVTLEVRDTIELHLKDLLGNFHKAIEMYTVGYQCSKQEVFHEYDSNFVEEAQIYKKKEIKCPRHGLVHHHILSESVLLFYWKKDVQGDVRDLNESSGGNEDKILSESELKRNFKTFKKLTKIGREALQIYFDEIFPSVDKLSSDNKEDIQKGPFKLSEEQCDQLYPEDKSTPSSSTFDVTIMYKLLRNYGQNLPEPSNGWGKKPHIAQKRKTDDVERIRFYRNEVEHKTTANSIMEEEDFDIKWKDLSQAIIRLSGETLKQDIIKLRPQKNCHGGF